MKGALGVETTVQEDTFLAELLKFYRVQRHDFLNHFQVAMGYIQLGKAEKAFEYLQRAGQLATEQAAISRVSTPELAVELMRFETVCFNQGVEFRTCLAEDLPPLNWCSTYAAGMDILREEVNHASSVELCLSPGEKGIILKIKFSGMNQDRLDNLVVKLAAQDLDVWGLQKSEDPALEIYLKRLS
ncbi:MAG TPA: Spo0B domain-containing protein [Candidatus Deferrimicrobium sp.]|nr:Spo0B domain-containing protein [Candidatus Deferrimicrobium sp.]